MLSDCMFFQSRIFSTSFFMIWNSSQLRIADSRRMRILKGSLSDDEENDVLHNKPRYKIGRKL